MATRTGASFVTTLLTTFELLLHKLTGNTDMVVGLPAAGQSDLGHEAPRGPLCQPAGPAQPDRRGEAASWNT
jgi:hypothetical protein